MKYILFLLLALVFVSCRPILYNNGYFEEVVINFTEVNSAYDDYNSDLHIIGFHHLLHFSSNRNSQGADFDIVGSDLFIDWNQYEGSLTIDYDLGMEYYDYLKQMFDSINTEYNELGPFSIGYRHDISESEVRWTDLLMYASDSSGNYDIRYIYNELYNDSDSLLAAWTPSQSLDLINTNANELYPSFYGKDFYYFHLYGLDERKIEQLVFCSDRGGVFDIYEVNLSPDSSLIAFLNTAGEVVPVKSDLSSDYDDKCPFVNGEALVFASNRPGGYGGHDLYYALREGDQWGEAINFGEAINTEYDEYRPIVLFHEHFRNDLLIFSSNRPGGQGGYDLYYTGIKSIVN